MKNISPLVSICCITYNQRPFIRECLNGLVMQQTDFSFEILIHDDASTDGTQAVIREFADRYPELIKAYFQEKNQFSAGCREVNEKFNFPRVRGKYAAMCEGDDYWLDPLKLQKQVDFMEQHPDFSICCHPAMIQYGSAPISANSPKYPAEKHRFFAEHGAVPMSFLLKENPIATASVMYRWQLDEKSLSSAVPVNIMPLDWYWHLFHAKSGKIGYLPEAMSVYRRHDGGIFAATEHSDALHFKTHKETLTNFFEAVDTLLADMPEYRKIWEKTYLSVRSQMAYWFKYSGDEESVLWFKKRFPGQFHALARRTRFRRAAGKFCRALLKICRKKNPA